MICDNCLFEPACTTGCEKFMASLKNYGSLEILKLHDKIFKRWLYGVRPQSYYDNIQKIINGTSNDKP